MERGHKYKLVFNSKSGEVTTIEEISKKGNEAINVVNNISASTSVSAFPKAKLEICPTSKYPNLLSVKSGDEVTIYVSEIDKPFSKIHQGIFLKVTVKAEKDKFDLILESVSAFYLLQKVKVSFSDFKTKNGFREILTELMALCSINGNVEVNSNIPNDFALTPFKNFSAFSLINAICYDLDLVYDFNDGDIMSISKRIDVLSEMQNSIPITLDGDKIISSEFNQ